jgi:hypothetical protein
MNKLIRLALKQFITEQAEDKRGEINFLMSIIGSAHKGAAHGWNRKKIIDVKANRAQEISKGIITFPKLPNSERKDIFARPLFQSGFDKFDLLPKMANDDPSMC